jgi:hypothetical protein
MLWQILTWLEKRQQGVSEPASASLWNEREVCCLYFVGFGFWVMKDKAAKLI